MMELSPAQITGYHAHVYFDSSSLELAKELCLLAAEKFQVKMGRLHEKPIGPHPVWSCQLAFTPQEFQQIIPWLSLNRQGLSILVHPMTGDDLKDHTDYALWLGSQLELKLDIFKH